jgi:hypothetical protein
MEIIMAMHTLEAGINGTIVEFEVSSSELEWWNSFWKNEYSKYSAIPEFIEAREAAKASGKDRFDFDSATWSVE